MRKLITCLCLVALSGISPVTMAEDAGKAILEAGINASFSEAERQLIKKYFGEQEVTYHVEEETKSKKSKDKKSNKGLPPGLAKRDKLPPGLERQLQKNGTLPPGLAKKSLPSDLSRQLPPTPEGYERQIVEDAAIVLVHKATGKIADVITDAMLGD